MADSMWDSAKAGYKALAGMRSKGSQMWSDSNREGAGARGLVQRGFSPAELRAIHKLAGSGDK